MMILHLEDLVVNILMNSQKNIANKNVLIIFTKYPQPGFVKTRLSKVIGRDAAASLYRLFVETIIKSTQDYAFRRIICFTPGNRKREFANWLGRNLEFIPQAEGGLGKRLCGVFRTVFEQGAKKVVVIGTDSPFINNDIIRNAFRVLKAKQCVIGPCLDGGYYLLGLSGFYKEVFEGINWSTDKVFKQTLGVVKRLGLQLGLLKEGFDVDDIEGLLLADEMLKK